MIKVYFKEESHYYTNGCSCCEPMEFKELWFSHSDGDLSYQQQDYLSESGGTSEEYRCLVNVSYIVSETSLSYHEYVDWCYNLFNFEQMEGLLRHEGVEVIFLEEE